MKKVNTNMKPPKRVKITLRDLAGWFKKIKLDLRFQRPIAWEAINRNGFIRSVMREIGNVNFCVASVKECMKYCEERGLTDDVEYFRKISLTHSYVSIDGNNRVSVLHNFINGNEDPTTKKPLEIDFGPDPYNIDVYDEDKKSKTYGKVIKTISAILGKTTNRLFPSIETQR